MNKKTLQSIIESWVRTFEIEGIVTSYMEGLLAEQIITAQDGEKPEPQGNYRLRCSDCIDKGIDPCPHQPEPQATAQEGENVTKSDKVTNEQAILDCPFCGSRAELFQRELFDDDNWDVACSNKDCYLSDGGDWWLVKNEAIKIWNNRQILTPQEGEFLKIPIHKMNDGTPFVYVADVPTMLCNIPASPKDGE